MNCTAEKQLSHGVFESFEIRKDSFFTVPQCEDTAPIQIGEILNNTYLITRFIAQGGMGIVYEGIDLVLHRKVAIKVLVTDFDDEEYEKELKLFQTEINLCGNLRHPNVIQIYYSGIHHRLPYLVMEYIEGIPINEYVMKQRRFNWNQKVKLISQVASGLAYIHKNNILHRDIKPSNILVKADGTPVLIDFGISIKKNLATVATNEGELSGTIHYMSPEQVAGEYDKINERSDIYSLGLILYELLIKRPAYTGSPNEIIGQIFNSSLLPPSDVNINISEILSNITMKAIAKEPEERYSTATEFIEDLRLYLKNGNNQRVVKTVSLSEKVSYYLKPNRKIAVALGCIMIFFMAILCIYSIADRRSNPESPNDPIARKSNPASSNNEVLGLIAKKDQESQYKPGQTEEENKPIQRMPTIPSNGNRVNTLAENTENKKTQQKETPLLSVDTTEDTAQVEKDTTETHNGKTTHNPGSSKPVSPNVEKPVKPVKPSPDDDEDNPYIPGSEKNRNREEFSVAYLVPNIVQDSVSTKESPFQNKIFEKFTVQKEPHLIENIEFIATIERVEIEFWKHNETGVEFYPIRGNYSFLRDKQDGAFFTNRWDNTDFQNRENTSILLVSKPITQKIWDQVMHTTPWRDLNMKDDDDAPVIGYTEKEKQQFLKKLSFKYKDQSNKERTISPQCFSLSLLAKLQATESEESYEDTESVRPIIIIPEDDNYKSNEEQIIATKLFKKSNPIKIKGKKYPVFVYENMDFILVKKDNPTGISFLFAREKCDKYLWEVVMSSVSWQVLIVSDSEISPILTPFTPGDEEKFRPVITIPKNPASDSFIDQIVATGKFMGPYPIQLEDKEYNGFMPNDLNYEMEFILVEKDDDSSQAFLIALKKCSKKEWLNIMNTMESILCEQNFLHSTNLLDLDLKSQLKFKPIVMIPHEESPINSNMTLIDKILNTGKFVEVPSIEDSASEVFVHARTGIEFTIINTKEGLPCLVARNGDEWQGEDANNASDMILEDIKNLEAELFNSYHVLFFHGSQITLYKLYK